MAPINNLRQKAIFDQFSMPDLSGGSLSAGLGNMSMGTSFMPDAQSPTYEDQGSMRSSDIQTSFRKPEDIQGIGASNISKVSDVSTKPQDYGEISLPDTVKTINDMYTPATRADDRLNNLLDNVPDINDYNPSFMRKLTAGLQGMKDPSVGQRTLNQPYLQDMGQWTAKTAPFQAAATGENARNTNERTLASNVATSIIANNRNASNQRIADQKNETTRARDAAKAESDRIRARAYAYSQSIGKGYDWDLSGPTAKKINKSTGDIIDTGIQTGKMDEELKIDLQNEGKIEASRVQGEAAMQKQAAAGTGNIKVGNQVFRPDPDNPGNYIPTTGLPSTGTPSRLGSGTGSSGTKTNTLEDIRQRQEGMRAYMELHGGEDTVKKWTQKGQDGQYQMKTRPVVGEGGIFGTGYRAYTQKDVDEWDAVKRDIDPTYNPSSGQSSQSGGGVSPSADTQNAMIRLTAILSEPNVPPQLKEQARNQIESLKMKAVLQEYDSTHGSDWSTPEGQARRSKSPTLDVREAPIPPSVQNQNQGIPQSAAPPPPPQVDRKAQLTQMLQNPNAEPRLKQAWQAELAQLQTNERNQQSSATRDITRANEIAQLLQNPNLDPRSKQILMDQARGLPAPGQVPPSPMGQVGGGSQYQGPSISDLQDQISILNMKRQNPGNSERIRLDIDNKINELKGQLRQANYPPMGPTQPPPMPQHAAPPQQDIQSKAADYLKQNGKPVTPANVNWVIQQGMVR